MTVSIKKHFKHMPTQEQIEMQRVMNAVQDDLANLRAAIVGITAKLDADAGITDTNYAALHDPDALNLVD